MKISLLRTTVGWTLIFTQLAFIALVIIYHLDDKFLFKEVTTILTLMCPVIAVYAGSAFKYFSTMKSTHEMDLICPPNYVAVMIVYSIAFAALLLGAVLVRAYGIGLENFEHFKYAVGLSETLFGVFLAKVTSELFPSDSTPLTHDAQTN